MSNKKKDGKKQYGSYLEFLETRLNSENYKKKVTKEEYDKTKKKYEREKLIQRILNKGK